MKPFDFGSELLIEIRYVYHDLSKIHFLLAVLKIIFQLPNLTSNFETRKNIGENFDYIYIDYVCIIYVTLGYKHN